MPEDKNIKTKAGSDNNLQQLVDCCNNAWDNLKKLQSQLGNIIKVRKQQAEAKGSGSDMVLSQAQDALDAIKNLEEINPVLTKAVDKMKEAYLQALTLSKQVSVKVEAAPSALGIGGHAENNKDQKKSEQEDQTDS